MSLRNRLSREQIESDFTHEGWFMACPVYAKPVPEMVVITKNWIPEFWLGFNVWLHNAIAQVGLSVMPGYEPQPFEFKLRPIRKREPDAHSV